MMYNLIFNRNIYIKKLGSEKLVSRVCCFVIGECVLSLVVV